MPPHAPTTNSTPPPKSRFTLLFASRTPETRKSTQKTYHSTLFLLEKHHLPQAPPGRWTNVTVHEAASTRLSPPPSSPNQPPSSPSKSAVKSKIIFPRPQEFQHSADQDAWAIRRRKEELRRHRERRRGEVADALPGVLARLGALEEQLRAVARMENAWLELEEAVMGDGREFPLKLLRAEVDEALAGLGCLK